LLLLGSGPGIGVGVASHFAARGFAIALISRNATRLSNDAETVHRTAAAAGQPNAVVRTYPADVSDEAALKAALAAVETDLGAPEVVVYNASRLRASRLGAYAAGEVIEDFKTATVGLYVTANWAMPHLLSFVGKAGRKPALLVTSGGLYKEAFAPYFSLGVSKAAQHSLTVSLSQVLAKRGVHVAAVVVHGLVKPDGGVFSPGRIAERYWELYEQ
ncbi:NAD(P)-binding protein, partial [Trichodelitschia bisporula]